MYAAKASILVTAELDANLYKIDDQSVDQIEKFFDGMLQNIDQKSDKEIVMAQTILNNIKLFTESMQEVSKCTIEIQGSTNPQATLKSLLENNKYFGGNTFEFLYNHPNLYPGLEKLTSEISKLSKEYGSARNSDFGYVALGSLSKANTDMVDEITQKMAEAFSTSISQEELLTLSEKYLNKIDKLARKIEKFEEIQKDRLDEIKSFKLLNDYTSYDPKAAAMDDSYESIKIVKAASTFEPTIHTLNEKSVNRMAKFFDDFIKNEGKNRIRN